MKRSIKAQLLLAENIRTLLYRRRLEAGALAIWCGHKPPWISKIISGRRGVQIPDLGRIADFFGLTIAELFSPALSHVAERRKDQRRSGAERRSGKDRRQPLEGRLHPELEIKFPPKRIVDDDGVARRPKKFPKQRRPVPDTEDEPIIHAPVRVGLMRQRDTP